MALVKLNNNGVKNATAFGSAVTSLGSMVFIKKLTASSSATLSFVHGSGGVDFSTYKEYVFTFKNIHAATDNVKFEFNGSVDAGSNYNVVKTTTMIDAYHGESGSYGVLQYGGLSLAQSTAFQNLANDQGNANDENVGGYLHLYNPSSTTFVKHFTASTSRTSHNDISAQQHYGGYFNNTADIDAIRFQFNSGNIDAGDICLYGIA